MRSDGTCGVAAMGKDSGMSKCVLKETLDCFVYNGRNKHLFPKEYTIEDIGDGEIMINENTGAKIGWVIVIFPGSLNSLPPEKFNEKYTFIN